MQFDSIRFNSIRSDLVRFELNLQFEAFNLEQLRTGVQVKLLEC